jgi:serine/threonine protein kinase
VVIADFGLSKFMSPSEVMNMPCGTLAYVAPEVLKLQGYGKVSTSLPSFSVLPPRPPTPSPPPFPFPLPFLTIPSLPTLCLFCC